MAFTLDMVGLVVQDMAASLRFYRLLGLDVPDPEDNGPYTQYQQPNGLRISWNLESMMREIDPAWVPPVGQRVGLAFLCDSPSDVDAVYQRMVEAGYSGHKQPWDAFWGQRYAIVMDPDGLAVELFAPLAV